MLYNQTMSKNNLQLTQLQLYISNIKRCLDIVDLLSVTRQDHQCYTLIKCETLLISQLFKNHNNIQQDPYHQAEKFTSPNTLFLIMYPSTNTRSRSTEKLTIYTEATDITSSSYPFVSKYYLDASLHSLNIQLKILTHFVEKKIEELKVFRNEMADIKSETH